jgi:hypothetical protein
VNWRAIGCGTIAAVAFVAIGLWGMSLAFSRFEGCPPSLQWGDRRYEPSGPTTDAPTFDRPGEPVPLGSTFMGLTTRTVFGPPGSEPSPPATDRPTQVAVDCGDESFQTYDLTDILLPTDAGAARSRP